MNRYALLLATLVVCATSQAAAQDQPIDSAQLAAIARFRPRTRVRLSVRGDGRAEGMLVSSDGGTIILGGAGEERRVPGAAMDSAWVRGNSAGTGALIGALAAGVALGTILAVDDNQRCSRPGSDSSCNTPLFFGVGFGAGGLVGAGLGALIGLAIPKWHRSWP